MKRKWWIVMAVVVVVACLGYMGYNTLQGGATPQVMADSAAETAVVERGTRKRVQQKLKADRQRMSPEQIAASQAKLDDIYQAEEIAAEEAIDRDPGVAALLERGHRVLTQPDLAEELAEDITNVMVDIGQAEANDEKEKVEGLCDELIDLLMEAEE